MEDKKKIFWIIGVIIVIALIGEQGKKEGKFTPEQCGTDIPCINCVNQAHVCWFSVADSGWYERGFGYSNGVCGLEPFFGNKYLTESQCKQNMNLPGPTCTETDGGDNEFIKGTTTLGSNLYTDYCYSSSSVMEYYCGGGTTSQSVTNSVKDCSPGTCSDGACIPSDSVPCVDSDEGLTYTQAGQVTSTTSLGPRITYDTCLFDGNTVVEQYCSNGDNKEASKNCKDFGATWSCSSNKCVDIRTPCMVTSWGPSPSIVCQGVPFNQTSNCNTVRQSFGDKVEGCTTIPSTSVCCQSGILGTPFIVEGTSCPFGVSKVENTKCSTPVCTPDNSCAANTDIGKTCVNSCGVAIPGTKVIPGGTWSPLKSTIDCGESFSQINNATGAARDAVGTLCESGTCNAKTNECDEGFDFGKLLPFIIIFFIVIIGIKMIGKNQ